MSTEPCPDWHSRPEGGCYMEDCYLGDGEWESYEVHCPNCCPDLIDPDKDTE